ncbi:MAG: excinuclease ABC subunit B [Lachnospiraceae bacterium]|nr:excinuclease ABC subunit B [Lachnospiraceae bacterium]
MLCEHCKTREATVKYVEVINGVKTEHNLCSHCARSVDIGQYSALFEGEFPLGRLLAGLLGMQNAESGTARYDSVACPNCHTTYGEFVQNSRFGCPDCYSVFDPLIGDNIKKLQGNERHVGKRPKSVSGQADSGGERHNTAGPAAGTENEAAGFQKLDARERVQILHARLKEALRREDYEQAAALRDEMRGLKEEIKQDGEMV